MVVAIALARWRGGRLAGNRIVDASTSDSPGAPARTDAPRWTPRPADPADARSDDDPPRRTGVRPDRDAASASFLAAYRQQFGTSQVVDLTLYGDYVIVNVPVPGKARQSGLAATATAEWTSFGGVRATFPGSAVVDTNRLDIATLMRNIARARRTLNVERPAQAYVILRFIPRFDEVPSVDIHVVNQFQESGYLATTLDGQVERAYPYAR